MTRVSEPVEMFILDLDAFSFDLLYLLPIRIDYGRASLTQQLNDVRILEGKRHDCNFDFV